MLTVSRVRHIFCMQRLTIIKPQPTDFALMAKLDHCCLFAASCLTVVPLSPFSSHCQTVCRSPFACCILSVTDVCGVFWQVCLF